MKFNIRHVIHRAGIRNALADTCSRAFNVPRADARLLIEQAGPEQAVVRLNELHEARGNDSGDVQPALMAGICILAELAEQGRNTLWESVDSQISAKWAKSNIETGHGRSEYHPTDPGERAPSADLIAALSPQQTDAFEKIHNAKVGHFGWRRTYLKATKAFPVLNFSSNDIRDAVAECGVCQKYRPNLDSPTEAPRHSLPIPARHGLVTMDPFKLKETKRGHNYVLVIIDHATKVASLQAMKTKSAEEVTKQALAYITRNGIPNMILTDPGPEFVNIDLESLLKWLGIEKGLSIAKRPQGHGTEKTVGRTKRHLSILASTASMREEWDEECMLAITELILNSNIHEEINKTPLEMKLGSISADAMQKLLDEGVMKTPENATELVRKLNDNLRELHEASVAYRTELTEKRRKKGTDPAARHQYQKGDLVLWRSDAPFKVGGPLAARLIGPMLVQQQTGNVLEVESLTDGKTRRLHYDRVSIFCADLEIARELAAHDRQEHIITMITQHKGNLEAGRAHTTYRVLFADGDIQWLDYADVMDTEALELYAGSKECTKLLLAGTAKEAQDRKRSLQGITMTEAAEAGIIPALTVKQKVWISTHAFVRSLEFDEGDLPHQETKEVFVEAQIDKLGPSRVDLRVKGCRGILAYAVWRVVAYLRTTPPGENQALVTPLMFMAKPHLLEAITGKASNTPRSNNDGLQEKPSTVTQHWVHDEDNTWRRAQFEGFEGALHILYCPELRKEFTVPPNRHRISKPNSKSAPSKHSA